MKDVLDTSELELRCSSADPNYGHLWFQCRKSPIDTAREVIAGAKSLMTENILKYSPIYIAAMVRRAGILMTIHHQADMITMPFDGEGTIMKYSQELPRLNSRDWDKIVDSRLRAAPLLAEMLSGSGNKIEGQKNLEQQERSTSPTVIGSMFITGYVERNKSWDNLSLNEKQRLLFGSDSLLS